MIKTVEKITSKLNFPISHEQTLSILNDYQKIVCPYNQINDLRKFYFNAKKGQNHNYFTQKTHIIKRCFLKIFRKMFAFEKKRKKYQNEKDYLMSFYKK